MFMAIYKGEIYMVKFGDKDYCFAYKKPVSSVLTITADGTVLANADVVMNGTTYTTNASGQITLTGNYSDVLNCEFGYNNKEYVGTAEIVFDGNNYTVNLVYNTVTLTVKRYETRYQTLITIYNGTTYKNEVTLQVVKGSSVRVYSGGNWDYTGAIKVNGTSSGKTDYTFTVTKDTTVTTTQPYDDSSCGSEGGGCGGGEG